MENGTAEKKAIAKLSAMEINKRKSAVAEDVQSKKDRYSKISSIELAALLGIDEGGRPGCGEASKLTMHNHHAFYDDARY